MEERYPVLSGAESFFIKGNRVGLLICHGFVGTPQSVRYLGEALANHGFTVYGVRLSGHGTHYKDMENCSFQDWKKSLEDGYRFLQQHCDEIFVIGQSMGGTLTLNLASNFPSVNGIVLVNAAMTSIPPMEDYKNKVTPRFIPEGEPDIKDKNVKEITYSKAPIASINQLFALMEETKDRLSTITCPTLAFQSTADHVVPPENTDFIIENIQSTKQEIVVLINSFHVASMDFDKDFIVEKCVAFLKENVEAVSEMVGV